MKVITLSRNRVTVVDDEDFERLAQFRWHYSKVGYATRTKKKGRKSWKILMHREIMGDPEGKEVDHRNTDPLDNRRENLRVSSHLQNSYNRGKNKNNTSGYKGVSFSKKEQKWISQIVADGKHRRLGSFDTPEEAASAYLTAALEFHGEFANLN